MEGTHITEDVNDSERKRNIPTAYIITVAALIMITLVSVYAVLNANKVNKNNKSGKDVTSRIVSQTVYSDNTAENTVESEVASLEENSEPVKLPQFTVTDLSATMYATINLNVRTYPGKEGKIMGSIKKGAPVAVTGKSSTGWYRVDYNNTQGFCSGKYLSDTEIPVAATVTEQVAAPAINTEKPYYLKVNITKNIITVYVKNENGEYTVPVKAMYCSTGLEDKTPTGTFNSLNKYRWKDLKGDVFGQYCTRITGHILFHSVPYNTQNNADLNYNKYNKLGTAASAGCIRLCTADAKWIYDNCPLGTTITMYRSDAPEPISPPEPIKIDVNDPRRGWDPTDPDPNNPWLAQ
ncbi:MAG: L,D-transpeptidase family protein [Clostridia bacterium]|nr:L,D-transpeptidase family protein [Clostridia bacterium]